MWVFECKNIEKETDKALLLKKRTNLIEIQIWFPKKMVKTSYDKQLNNEKKYTVELNDKKGDKEWMLLVKHQFLAGPRSNAFTKFTKMTVAEFNDKFKNHGIRFNKLRLDDEDREAREEM